MRTLLSRVTLIMLLALSSLVAGTSRLEAQDFPEALEVPDEDLDALSNKQLDVAFAAELDDVLVDLQPDALYPLETLHAEFMEALSDEGDKEDPAEDVIDLVDLEAEMAEEDTTVADVVWRALADGDSESAWWGRPYRPSPLSSGAPPAPRGGQLGGLGRLDPIQDLGLRDRAAKPRVAITKVSKLLRSVIRLGR